MTKDTSLYTALMQVNIKDIENISVDGYVNVLVDSGEFKSRREAVQYIERTVLDRLAVGEKQEYEKCAWLKHKLDKIKNKFKVKNAGNTHLLL